MLALVAAAAAAAAATASPPGAAASRAALPATMRAVQSAAPGCGAPDFGCVGVVTVATPVPQPAEVLIRVTGSSCGVTDVVEAGPHPWLPLGPRRLLGYNVAGTVAAIGTEAEAAGRLQIGDSVWTMLGGRCDGSGAYADYVAAVAEGVALFPPSLGSSLLSAATLVGPALTDWFAFAAGGAPWTAAAAAHGVNTTAVIVSGSGGTGYVAVQLAKALGMRRVVTAATGASTIAWVRSLGADVVVDYKLQEALEAVPDNSVDFVYDNYDKTSHTAELAMRKLRPGGVFVGIVSTKLAPTPKRGVKQLYFDLPDALNNNETRKREGLDAVASLIGGGKLRPFVQQTFSLEGVPAALAMVAKGVGLVSKLAVNVSAAN